MPKGNLLHFNDWVGQLVEGPSAAEMEIKQKHQTEAKFFFILTELN